MRYLRNQYQDFYGYGDIIFQSVHDIQREFPKRHLQHSFQMLEVTKRDSNVHLNFANSGYT